MRLDNLLVEKGMFDTRTKAKQAIERGEIIIDGRKICKPSFAVNDSAAVFIERKFSESYVSLGGYKLSKALKDFSLDVNGLTVADIGASTGGFTDCLLQVGAKRVFAVDLNDGLLHEKLKKDNRVFNIIKNSKDLCKDDFPDKIDMLVADLSFISETLTIPVFYNLLDEGSYAIILIKPQFENRLKIKFKNGIIKDEKILKAACEKVYLCAVHCGFCAENITSAPINDKKNREFLILLKKSKSPSPPFSEFIKKIFIKK